MGFNLNDYETVESRIERFWQQHPGGAIRTTAVMIDDARVVFRAEAYKDASSPLPDATGYADEVKGTTNVNRTNHVENCETSAIGRALANLGFATSGKRPSREEMEKVAYAGHTEEPTPNSQAASYMSSLKLTAADKDLIRETAKVLGVDAVGLTLQCRDNGIKARAALVNHLGELASKAGAK